MIKTIKSPNFNGKFLSRYFIILSNSPAQKIPESTLPLPVIIEDPSGEVPAFKAQLINFVRLPLFKVHDFDTRLANGMASDEFIAWFKNENNGVDNNTELAIYMYERFF